MRYLLNSFSRRFELGVRGMMQRTLNPDQVRSLLRRVASGEMQIEISPPRANGQLPGHASLTPREREIFAELQKGLRNKQIAAEMGITEGTIKIYLFRLFHKLQVRNRSELSRVTIPDEERSLKAISRNQPILM
jgi:two-component system nitrate/nitrite response regulator NarL